MEKSNKSEASKVEILLKVDTPQKGKTFVANMAGKKVTFKIVDITSEQLPKKTKHELLEEIEAIRADLKSDNFS